jgi:hypothetical protein
MGNALKTIAELGLALGVNLLQPPRQPSGEDFCVWPDGTCCTRDELEDYLSFMSDDFMVVPLDHPDYQLYADDGFVPTAEDIWEARVHDAKRLGLELCEFTYPREDGDTGVRTVGAVLASQGLSANLYTGGDNW